MRRTLPRAALVCALAASAVALTSAAPARPASPLAGESPAAAVARLKGLGLRAVPASDKDDFSGGAFLCAEGRDPAVLRGLLRQKCRAADWEGVVLMKRAAAADDRLDAELAEWGGNGLRVAPYVFFGDEQIVARIQAELGASR